VDPLVIYLLIFVAGAAFLAVAASFSSGSTRHCPACDDETPTSSRRCKGCGYRFS
jgi:predicted amidophosphoribosyltransferase